MSAEGTAGVIFGFSSPRSSEALVGVAPRACGEARGRREARMTQPCLSVPSLEAGSEGFQREKEGGAGGPRVCFSLLRTRRDMWRKEQAWDKL